MTTGKWKQQGVPHKGWTNTDMEDLGFPHEICEMCEVQEIRYVHIMEHDDFPEPLRVGCICAGNMEEDRQSAKMRENAFKNFGRRRQNWLKRKSWRQSSGGNPTIKSDGYRITVFRKGDKIWSGVITELATGKETWARKRYRTESEAKLAAFDGMVWLMTRRDGKT